MEPFTSTPIIGTKIKVQNIIKKKTNESLTALGALGFGMAAMQKRKNDELNYKPGTGRKIDTAGTVANILRNKGKLVTRPDN